MVRVKAARLRARIVQQMAAHVDRYYLQVDLDAARDMPLYLGHASLSGMAPRKGWGGFRAKF